MTEEELKYLEEPLWPRGLEWAPIKVEVYRRLIATAREANELAAQIAAMKDDGGGHRG